MEKFPISLRHDAYEFDLKTISVDARGVVVTKTVENNKTAGRAIIRENVDAVTSEIGLGGDRRAKRRGEEGGGKRVFGRFREDVRRRATTTKAGRDDRQIISRPSRRNATTLTSKEKKNT